ncbi:cap-specific mRNA (nucleoside-2'-O-)-methyltransferase 2 [Dryobates pubescens]|uniref:cap-specific mRNA (nucleoside-2'-O-)-methyltransferase 2 n=1 Tax=Dryobates pubescens TaxID=118200 RepID=UPI0023B8DCEA|nr:cap-specific mRNA (nucleoside-2'-O-)-methyltransferase 2 [Dryobates pubescens]
MSSCKRQLCAEQPASLEGFSPEVLSDVEKLFAKKFTYPKPADEDWQLPDPSEAFTSPHKEFHSLLALKDSLNHVKNQLSDKNLEEWHQHTSFTNKAGKVVPQVRKSANAELCTQAWCKFHEILGSFPLLPEEALEEGELNSVHLCEAPGAFVASLNHYLKSHQVPCAWNWVATSLNPYHEANDSLTMIADDRLIANTLPRWYFGPDDTGDVMSPEHLAGLQSLVGSAAAVHLVTADGSFDCQGNPGEQEALVCPLHYCEAVTALLLLGAGGSFVLKVFTLFQHCSANLLFLLNCAFQEVHVFKPATSKAGNSEAYAVCLRYLGRESVHPLLARMRRRFGARMLGSALFPQHLLPPSFLRAHEECCAFFQRRQAEAIGENLRLFERMGRAEQARLGAARDCAARLFLRRFRLKPIARSQWLVGQPQAGCSTSARWCGQRSKAFSTYNERKLLEALSWSEKVAKGCFSRWAEEHSLSNAGKLCLLEGPPSNPECSLWHVLEGRRLPVVKCSPFCDGQVLGLLNEALSDLVGAGPSSAAAPQPCPSCEVLPGPLLLAEVSDLARSRQEVPGESCPGHFKCLVVDFPSLSGSEGQAGMEVELLDSGTLPAFGFSLLYDGDPRYQRQLLGCVLRCLGQLAAGDALVLPILSCLTRFTAGLLFVLHCAFRTLAFAGPTCPRPLRPGAALLCVGYRGLPQPAVRYLQRLQELVGSLLDADSPRQVLQFVPMEVLLQGKLLEFLWDLNTAVAKRQLHLAVQAQRQGTGRGAL